MIRKPYRPGLHGKSRRRRRLSEYGQQLIEKQKVRLLYGVSEKQFKNYVKATAPKKEVIKGVKLIAVFNEIPVIIERNINK